jgi:stage V sporulation protein D (sporulation-specific penicillin-binding protein)
MMGYLMKNREPNNLMKRRLFIVLVVISFFFIYISINYYKIQILDKNFYAEKALANQMKTFDLPAKRGMIFDRNGEKLAYSVSRYKVYLDKNIFNVINKDELIEILDIDLEKFDYLYNQNNNNYTLARHIELEKYSQLKIKNYDGIWLEDDPMRIYPNDDFASRVIGNTNIDMDGITGIEYSMNEVLKGINGTIRVKTDAIGRKLPYGEEKIVDPILGANIYLTIDKVIQYFVEKSIANGMEVSGAKSIYSIVMNVKNGEILAMASSPTYDLNNPRIKSEGITDDKYNSLSEKEKVELWNNNWKNPNVSNVIEPGSTFKIVTAAIGLEENIVEPSTIFNEQTGYIDVYDRKIKCWFYPNHHGKETFVEALENSCNPVFVKVAQDIGVDKYHDGLLKFGLNDELTIELPGVVDYKVREKEDIGPVELATMSYGHGIATTPLQLIRTLSAIVNDGNLVEPKMIKKIVNSDDEIIEENLDREKRKVISDETSRDIRLMLESVVKNGSGKGANISGIRVGGKTGTTIKLVDGEYDDEKVIASFFAFAPVEDPEIAVLVIVDEPESSVYGSVVAAPIVKDILESTLRHIGIKPSFKE